MNGIYGRGIWWDQGKRDIFRSLQRVGIGNIKECAWIGFHTSWFVLETPELDVVGSYKWKMLLCMRHLLVSESIVCWPKSLNYLLGSCLFWLISGIQVTCLTSVSPRWLTWDIWGTVELYRNSGGQVDNMRVKVAWLDLIRITLIFHLISPISKRERCSWRQGKWVVTGCDKSRIISKHMEKYVRVIRLRIGHDLKMSSCVTLVSKELGKFNVV